MRVFSHDLEMRSVNPSKTPFFDTLTTFQLWIWRRSIRRFPSEFSKGRFYDFAGSFRRDRNYFDYNLLAELVPVTATPHACPGSEPDSLHLFNTVRRNTDTLLTLFPLSRISFRAGFNLMVPMRGRPTVRCTMAPATCRCSQWFRNSIDTYTGGVDVKLAKRTTLSYDQFYVLYKGDSSFQLAPTPFIAFQWNPGFAGRRFLTGPTRTCGSGANKTTEVVNGIVNPYCMRNHR